MKLITRQINANEAAEKYKNQYSAISEKYIKLKALGANPNPDDVDKVVGNKSWTRVGSCYECDTEVDKLIRIGEEPDHDSNTTWICINCINEAYVEIGS